MTHTVAAETWAKRIQLELSPAKTKQIKKGKKALVMKDKQLYEIIPIEVPKLFNADGKPVTKALLKRLLRKM